VNPSDRPSSAKEGPACIWKRGDRPVVFLSSLKASAQGRRRACSRSQLRQCADADAGPPPRHRARSSICPGRLLQCLINFGDHAGARKAMAACDHASVDRAHQPPHIFGSTSTTHPLHYDGRLLLVGACTLYTCITDLYMYLSPGTFNFCINSEVLRKLDHGVAYLGGGSSPC
jgi:hypothetical protein